MADDPLEPGMDNYDPPSAPERRRRESTGLLVAIASLALALMVQFGGTIWWGATMSADMRHMTEAMTRVETERYTKSDAARDTLRLDQRDTLFAEQMNEIRARISRIEDRANHK